MTAKATPRTVEEHLAILRLRRLDRETRVADWNHQMHRVVATIREAADSGRGVIITTSLAGNYIAAQPTIEVLAGWSAVFDLDADNPRPAYRPIHPANLPRRTA